MQLITQSKEAYIQGLQWIFINCNGKAVKIILISKIFTVSNSSFLTYNIISPLKAIIGVWFVYSWCYYYQISETRLFESILLWSQFIVGLGIIVALLSQLMKAIIHLMRDDARFLDFEFFFFFTLKFFRHTPSTEELLNLYGKIGFRSSLTTGGLSKTSFTSISRHASKGSIGKCDFV